MAVENPEQYDGDGEQTEEQAESVGDNDTVEWQDASKKSDGLLGRFIAGNGDGADPEQSKEGRDEVSKPIGQGNVEENRSNEAQGLVQSILDGLQESTLVVDTHGKITHCNEQALELYEHTEQEAIGLSPHALQADRSSASDIVAEAIDRGVDIQQREETMLVAGQETPLERTVTLLYDDKGKFNGAMLVEKDVTESNRQREKKEYLEQYQQNVLGNFQDKLARFAEGDLTIDPTVPEPDQDYDEAADVYDEFIRLNDHLAAAVDNIREIVERLTENADDLTDVGATLSANSEEVTASIQQIDASSSELAHGADDLAQDMERGSENVDDLSASIEEITASVQQIDAQSEEVVSLASDGVEDASAAVSQIREATDATSTVAQRIDSLEESMEEVGEIIDIIADISDQTNMLALNANIEAARAGEAGEGFAVVANEVKNLAEESQESAKDIAGIITDIQEQTADLVMSIEDANEEVEDGADEVETVVTRLEDIDERATQTSDGLTEITDAVESQAENAEQVSGIIEDTAGMTEEISASIQQISSGIDEQSEAMDDVAHRAEQVSSMSEELHERIDLFKVAADENANVEEMNR